MLNRLLELLRTGGTHRVSDLARELGATSELVKAMLENLARMGYLEQVSGECAEKCATCPMAELCTAGASGQVWTLADNR